MVYNEDNEFRFAKWAFSFLLLNIISQLHSLGQSDIHTSCSFWYENKDVETRNSYLTSDSKPYYIVSNNTSRLKWLIMLGNAKL